jgi:hypothetical protein
MMTLVPCFLFQEEVYMYITDPNHRELDITPEHILEEYHDFDAARECVGHAVHRVRYTPSWLLGQ